MAQPARKLVDAAIDIPLQKMEPAYALGVQPNGDFKLVVTISEPYVEGVRQWAESDGVSMEDWISYRLSSYLETWSAPAKGR